MSAIITQFETVRSLIELGHVDEALALCRAVLDRIARLPEPCDTAIRRCAAEALLVQGALLPRMELLDSALAACDEALQRFGDDSDEVIQGFAARALYNKGIALRDAGRRAEAVATFDDVIKRFADSPIDVSRWAALSLYGKSVELYKIDDQQACIATVEEMKRRFVASEDIWIRPRLAKALYLRATLLRRASKIEEAIRACCEIQTCFEKDSLPEIQTVVAAARRHDLFTLAIANPAFYSVLNVAELNMGMRESVTDSAHPERILGVINVIQGGDDFLGIPPPTLAEIRKADQNGTWPFPLPPDLCPEDRALTIDRVKHQVICDLEGHLRCAEILDKYLDEGEPFGLFLRNFDIEAYMQTLSEEPKRIRLNVQLARESQIERKLGDTLVRKLPMIGVGNTAPLRPDSKQTFPRLLLQNEYWKIFIEELIRGAAVVILEIVRLTPGVLTELEMIKQLKKQDQTLIVLSPDPENLSARIADILFDIDLADPPQRPDDSVFLASFGCIVRAADLSEAVMDMPCFADLVGRAEAIRRRPPADRIPWEGIAF